MKRSVFDEIKRIISNTIRRLCNHYYGCCQNITKNCGKCEFTEKE